MLGIGQLNVEGKEMKSVRVKGSGKRRSQPWGTLHCECVCDDTTSSCRMLLQCSDLLVVTCCFVLKGGRKVILRDTLRVSQVNYDSCNNGLG